MLGIKSGKRHLIDGMELPNENKFRTLGEEETYYTWTFWKLTPSHKWRWKTKLRKNISDELENHSRQNLIKGINTWALPHVRYSGHFVKWTREELKQMDQRIRKLMNMHKALYPRDDDDRLYVSRKEGRWRLASIEDIVDASIQQLKDYIEKHEGLITAIKNDTDNTVTNRITISRKQKWEEKWENIDVAKKRKFYRETESIQIAAKSKAIRTNRIKARTDKTKKIANVGYVVIETKRSIT